MLIEEDSEGSYNEDQQNFFDWELSVSEEEVSSEDEIENALDLSATSDATTFPATSISNQYPISSNPSIANRKAVGETESNATKWVFTSFGSEERGRRATTTFSQSDRDYPGGADESQIHFQVPFNYCWIITQFFLYKPVQMWKLEKHSAMKTGVCRVLIFWLLGL